MEEKEVATDQGHLSSFRLQVFLPVPKYWVLGPITSVTRKTKPILSRSSGTYTGSQLRMYSHITHTLLSQSSFDKGISFMPCEVRHLGHPLSPTLHAILGRFANASYNNDASPFTEV